MLKPHVLSALGYKLEEDGVVTPTVEAEVSASVEVTPEQQEAIDEAVTQIEEVATAGAELEEAVTQQEEVEEAEATLMAIADNLRTYGQLPQQMYDFLHKTGYLAVIAAAQSTAMNRVQYPAVESINPTALNRQVVDGIIAGCEAMMEGAGARVREFLKKIWDKIVELWDRLVVFVLGNKSQIERLGKKCSDARGSGSFDSSAKYNPRMMGAAQSEKVREWLNGNAKVLETAAKNFGEKSRWERLKANFDSKFMDESVDKAVRAMQDVNMDSFACNKETIGEALEITTYDKTAVTGAMSLLCSGGGMYKTAMAAVEAMKQAKSISSVAKTVGRNIDALNAETAKNTAEKNSGGGAAGRGNAFKSSTQATATEASKVYAKACSTFQKVCMFTIRSYIHAANVGISASGKAPKEAPAK